MNWTVFLKHIPGKSSAVSGLMLGGSYHDGEQEKEKWYLLILP